MALKKRVKATIKPEKIKEITYRERLANKEFNKTFVSTGKTVEVMVMVKSCAWCHELAGTIQSVVQIDFDFYLAVDFQDIRTPWLKFGFLAQNVDLLNQ